jgi:hypothetical protein
VFVEVEALPTIVTVAVAVVGGIVLLATVAGFAEAEFAAGVVLVEKVTGFDIPPESCSGCVTRVFSEQLVTPSLYHYAPTFRLGKRSMRIH